jgi:hypothetical protein
MSHMLHIISKSNVNLFTTNTIGKVTLFHPFYRTSFVCGPEREKKKTKMPVR